MTRSLATKVVLAVACVVVGPRAFARRAMFTGDGVVTAWARRVLGRAAPPLDSIRGEILRNQRAIEAHAQDAILRHANFRELRGFYIAYHAMQCVSAPRLSDSTRAFGSCIVKAHAFQLTADVAINVSPDGITVKALNTVVD